MDCVIQLGFPPAQSAALWAFTVGVRPIWCGQVDLVASNNLEKGRRAFQWPHKSGTVVRLFLSNQSSYMRVDDEGAYATLPYQFQWASRIDTWLGFNHKAREGLKKGKEIPLHSTNGLR